MRRLADLRWLQFWLAGALLSLGACQPDERCDTGFVFNDGQCIRGPKAPVDAGGDAGATDSGGSDTAITFGTPCKDGVNHSDCQSATTTVCLIAPGDTVGQCSAINCDQNPSVCPTGWSCYDLSVFQPGAPYGCVPF